ncbi:amidohydrolase family protein [Nitrospirillum sp. BR 11163]|uniref:amidohydrolase family protein n=1 Tax=Nitrospirillum sp. BR 11163 TaxID=3104323 RepID=UPI002AFEA32D|nr:amidohydrolase family protein [Nitrospirillum sp. BR 11163]MEA1672757.1 amidohydrolase family protein [Nitrospirillum sp. BR 11163]
MTVERPFAEPPIVDAHAHILTRRMPLRDDAWIRPDYDYTAEDFLADLDRHGIAFGIVTAASLYGDYNDYTLAALGRYRRLRATVMLQPDTDLATLRHLRDQGVVGVRMQWKVDQAPPDLRSYPYLKFLNRLADCGMHVELNASAVQLAVVLPALEAHGVNVVVDHFGLLRAPEGMEGAGFQAMLRAVAAGRTWVKISAGFRLDPAIRQACAARLLVEAGGERLLWGSDAPFVGKEGAVTYADALAHFHALAPDPAVRRQISDAALRLCFF